jgi:hypothetical protein
MPAVVPADQRWFWTPKWLAGEREASAEIAAGGLEIFADMDALFAAIGDGEEPARS